MQRQTQSKQPSTLALKYQHQASYLSYDANSETYRFAIIADMDKDSKVISGSDVNWVSSLMTGKLHRNRVNGLYTVEWEETIPVRSKLNEGGRGMELSDLCYFNNMLLTFDDRSGIVFEVNAAMKEVIPRYILADGNGNQSKGFKGEWCAVKGDQLWIGGLGKEWTTPKGEVVNHDPMWVKTINLNGEIEHHNWESVYNKMRSKVGASYPGYIIHEAVAFSTGNADLREPHWFFAPRRISTEPYDDEKDEFRCHNTAFIFDTDFATSKVKNDVGPFSATRGFSSVRFVPFREDEFVVLKTEEVDGISTYMAIYDVHGKVLMSERKIASVKYEGFEFLHK
eukprot:TRINITY_DN5281_c0_g1_i1.p1 TRINITY_DN5281_c0_g1~~TRINITY_DN5281_c0_g1_i1.p1  ORF type:complete len:387 (-),score=115.84 TRINITY_DN5281_c0_g1_i1:24-1040(-)